MLFKAVIEARGVSPTTASALFLYTSFLFWSVEYEKIMLIKAVVVARVVSPCFWYIELLSPSLAGSVRLLSPLLWRRSV